MQDNMIIIGNSTFMNAEYKSGVISLTNNKNAFELGKIYNVDNFSKKYLTIYESLKYISVFAKERKYNYAVISLGEGDLLLNTKVEEFKSLFDKLINKLAKLRIKITLVEPSLDKIEKYSTSEYKNAIDELYKKYDSDGKRFHNSDALSQKKH